MLDTFSVPCTLLLNPPRLHRPQSGHRSSRMQSDLQGHADQSLCRTTYRRRLVVIADRQLGCPRCAIAPLRYRESVIIGSAVMRTLHLPVKYGDGLPSYLAIWSQAHRASDLRICIRVP
jgi:hypothetical protein